MIFLILVVFLLIGGLVMFVAVQNLALQVQLNLLLWPTPKLPVSAWLIAAFLFGAIVLYLVSVLSAVGERHAMKALRRQVQKLEEQIATMSRTGSSSAEQTGIDNISAVDTGPLLTMPGMTNTPQSDGRRTTTPLQKFRR